MALSPKTTVVPPGDPKSVFGQQILKIVVIGNYPNLVQNSDDMAQNVVAFDRAVIWFQNGLPTSYGTQFGVPANVKAFALSTNNALSGVMQMTDAEDYVAIEQLFTKADQNS